MEPRMEPQTIMGMENPYIAKVLQTQPQVREALGAEPPVKEVRTYVRDGTTITEEYERLNPDGTVTKTVSVGDRRDGMKHFGVYKMDKSGIIRRIDNGDLAVDSATQSSSSYDQHARQQQVKAEEQRAMSYGRPSDSMDQMQGPDSQGSYSHPNNGQQMIRPTPSQSVQKQNQVLTPEQKTLILNNYKEKIIQYGSRKLENVIKHKLLSDKMNEISLTEEQIQKMVNYGINKFGKLLNKNFDDTKIMAEIEEYLSKKGAVSTPQVNIQDQTNPPVSFALQPNDVDPSTLQQHPQSVTQQRPVSFKIRPESVAKTYPASAQPQHKHYRVEDDIKSFWNEALSGGRPGEEEELQQQQQKQSSRDAVKSKELSDDRLSEFEKEIKRCLEDHDLKGKELLDKQDKEELIQYALKRFRKLEKERDVQDTERKEAKLEKTKQLEREAKQKRRDEKYKKYYDFGDLFNGDEDVFSSNMKALKKLLKKNEGKQKEESEAREVKQQIRDASYAPGQYQQKPNVYAAKDTQKQQYKANSPEQSYAPFQIRPQTNSQPKQENVSPQQKVQGSKWDFESFISQLMEKEPAKSKADATSTQKTEKKSNFDSFLSRIRQRVAQKTFGDVLSQQSDKPLKDKGAYSYQSRPQEGSKTKAETEGSKQKRATEFNFDSLLSLIRQTTTGTKEGTSSQKKESLNDKSTGFYQTRPQTDQIRNNGYTPSQDKDSSLNRIRRTMSHNSTTSTQPNQGSTTYRAQPQAPPSTATQRDYQNAGPISFQIHPQQHSKSKLESARPPATQRVHGGPNNEPLPWWFSQSSEPTVLRQPMLKDPITNKPQGSYVEDPLLGDSFFSAPLLGDSSFFTIPQLPNF